MSTSFWDIPYVNQTVHIHQILEKTGIQDEWNGQGMQRMEKINTYIMVRKSDGKRPHERPRHRWEDNMHMDHREIRLQDRIRIC